jgi:hypothetical protein
MYDKFITEYGEELLPEGGHFVTALEKGDKDMMVRHWDIKNRTLCLDLWGREFFGLGEEDV